MKRIIVFITDQGPVLHKIFDNDFMFVNYHFDFKNESPYYDIATSLLHFLSFDLLNEFSQIFLLHKGVKYELKLGANTWTKKELRKEHNLFKLAMNNIVNA